MAAPDVVELRPVSAEVSEQLSLPVTKAGDVADRAGLSQIVDIAMLSRRLESVDKRSTVVLYTTDSEMQPTWECASTVIAISQATGCVAVGLIGNGEYTEAWRREIDSTIPMGALGERMARTLALLAKGPPRNLRETLSVCRARNVRVQLAQEQSRGAGAAARLQRKMQLAAESAVRNAPQEVVDGPAGGQAELQGCTEIAATRLQQRCCGELGLRVEISVFTPESPARPSYTMDALGFLE